MAEAVKDQKTVPKSVKEIPGPPTFPVIGCLPTMVISLKSYPMKFIHKLLLDFTKKYGPVMRMENPQFPPAVVVTDPNYIETMVRATMDNPLRFGFFSLKKIRYEAIDNFFEGKAGLLIENGEEWRRVRSRVQTPMMKPKNVSSYLPEVDQVTLTFVERMASLQKQYGEMPKDFQMELYKWALECVGLVALNRRLGCLESDLHENSEPLRLINLVNDLFKCLHHNEFGLHVWRFFPTKTYRTLREKHNEFLRLADSNICETEAMLSAAGTEEREITLLERLLMVPGLSRKDVVTLILDMLFAGIDTTSHTIAFTLYLLARNPEVQAKLQQEVDTVVGDHDGPLTVHHLAQFSYMKAVIKETFRIFPLVIGTTRTLDKDLILGDYLIPKGWSVFGFSMATGWDEAYFPRVKEFVPERWLRHKPLGPIHPYAVLPFGAGTRMCIGRRIAEQEMYVFLARVMQRFTVDYKYEDIEGLTSLVFIPSQPLRFNLIERS